MTSVSVSNDSKFIASGSSDKKVILWKKNNEENNNNNNKYILFFTFEGHSDKVTSVAFSNNNNNKFIVSGSWDKTIKIWEI